MATRMRPNPAVIVTPIEPSNPKFTSSGPASTPDLQQSPSHDPFSSLSPTPPVNGLRHRRSQPSSLNQDGPGGGRERESAKGNDDTGEMMRWGWILLSGSTVSFIVGVWSIAVGPFLDTAGLPVLDMMAKDTHYKYLLVFLVPVTLYAVIVNWWGLKIFRHA